MKILALLLLPFLVQSTDQIFQPLQTAFQAQQKSFGILRILQKQFCQTTSNYFSTEIHTSNGFINQFQQIINRDQQEVYQANKQILYKEKELEKYQNQILQAQKQRESQKELYEKEMKEYQNQIQSAIGSAKLVAQMKYIEFQEHIDGSSMEDALGKLDQIRDKILVAKARDGQAEQKAQALYDKYVIELNQVIEKTKKNLENLREKSTRLGDMAGTLKQVQSSENQSLASFKDLQEVSEETCRGWDQKEVEKQIEFQTKSKILSELESLNTK